MDAELLEAALKAHILHMHERLYREASIATAAKACADTGNVSKAIEIALDIEHITYEVNTPLNAASLMQQICRQ